MDARSFPPAKATESQVGPGAVFQLSAVTAGPRRFLIANLTASSRSLAALHAILYAMQFLLIISELPLEHDSVGLEAMQRRNKHAKM